eukprot:GILJ01014927.1.p1 GENE.GILJ01014927.1~~GILJ01014927.1.p1  ORF type:complete len:191 (-),score=28.25 GILJ01014927.1:61-633(-)
MSISKKVSYSLGYLGVAMLMILPFVLSQAIPPPSAAFAGMGLNIDLSFLDPSYINAAISQAQAPNANAQPVSQVASSGSSQPAALTVQKPSSANNSPSNDGSTSSEGTATSGVVHSGGSYQTTTTTTANGTSVSTSTGNLGVAANVTAQLPSFILNQQAVPGLGAKGLSTIDPQTLMTIPLLQIPAHDST